VAAVGLAVGGGLYFAAISATVLILVILAGIKPLERRLFPKRRAPRIFLTVDRRETSLVAVMTEVEAAGLRVLQVVTEREDAPHRDRIQLFLPRSPEPALIALVDRLRAIPGVYKIDYPRYLER
jgi:putative Mg2+ transporter-C (MgtC) family protein